MKILLGMSGGLDSTYAAHCLTEEGHEVTGALLVMSGCTDEKAAVLSAAEAGVPLVRIDARERFSRAVVDPFVAEYFRGRTPNPCVLCNPAVKFGMLCEYAAANGFDRVSTGHYAAIGEENGRYFLKKALDRTKDQGYVLWSLSQKQLSMLYFPLSGKNKTDVRAAAKALGFTAAGAKDSQDICFIPDNDHARFIEEYTGEKARPGEFLDLNGKVVGKHRGIVHYTVGQRKGLGIALGEPVFVTKIDPESNTVTVAPAGHEYAGGMTVAGMKFQKTVLTAGETLSCLVKARYASPPVPATVRMETSDRASVVFASPVRAVTPGQSAVFCDENGDLLFGGQIEDAAPAEKTVTESRKDHES